MLTEEYMLLSRRLEKILSHLLKFYKKSKKDKFYVELEYDEDIIGNFGQRIKFNDTNNHIWYRKPKYWSIIVINY